jgi:5,10-methylene-tetrahydrofolate dehydrogenase/methenyl tetrahydrofolate cyclohydrolase
MVFNARRVLCQMWECMLTPAQLHQAAAEACSGLPALQVEGKTAVIVGDSNIVGMPLAMLLRDRGAAAVTVCHRPSYQVSMPAYIQPN